MKQLFSYIAASVIMVFAQLSLADISKTERDTQVTSLFLYNFANFAQWPEEAFETSEGPIRMCLFGNIPFDTYLDAVNGTPIGTRVLKIIRTSNKDDIRSGCHILFVSEESRAELPTFWNNVNHYYVLSVGEQDKFTERGGIINIMRTQDQLSFDINVQNALEAGLFLESELLNLAREIKKN